jgi:uroporphyrinogen-III decarboxylase
MSRRKLSVYTLNILKMMYPNVKEHLDVETLTRIDLRKIDHHTRLVNRIRDIEEYRKQCGEENFIVGWVEGSLAEYTNVRGFSNACLDLFEGPEIVNSVLAIILEMAFCLSLE